MFWPFEPVNGAVTTSEDEDFIEVEVDEEEDRQSDMHFNFPEEKNDSIFELTQLMNNVAITNQPYSVQPNHVPIKFLMERNITAFHFYLGLHTADGVNSSSGNRIGIFFKSSECIFLLNFLQSIGVEQPKLS